MINSPRRYVCASAPTVPFVKITKTRNGAVTGTSVSRFPARDACHGTSPSAYETATKLVAALSEQDVTIGGSVEFNARR
jgi:hypothetical protein